jgi:predicted lipoprotein with Yx(FWY)xxD motif
MTRFRLISLGAAAILPLAAAACGSSGSYGPGATAASPAAAAVTSAKKPALAVRKTSLGRVLVDAKGRTLYQFGADTKNKSNCDGSCATNWPPAASPKKPKVGSGVSQRKLKVITRSDGKKQLSYAGHPLYRFVGDSKPGDVKGQGINAFGGVWYVVAPSGAAVTSSAQSQQPAPSPGYPRSGGGY